VVRDLFTHHAASHLAAKRFDMRWSRKKTRRNTRNWTPYLLIAPSVVYLAVFFLWPMGRGLFLAFWDDDALLTLRTEARLDSPEADRLPQATQIDILDQQGNFVPLEELDEESLLTERWFLISGEDADGVAVEGYTPDARIRVREEAEDGTPTMGTVRRKLGRDADPLTDVLAEPNEESEVLGRLETGTGVAIVDQATLELWFLVQGEIDGEMLEGWAPSRYIQVFDDGTSGRIDRGNTAELTTRFFVKMVNDRFFWPAFRTTLLLMVIMIPAQFVLAFIMTLVIYKRLRGHRILLYLYSIPITASDLAIGIVFLSVFTQSGFLNSALQGLGLIDSPNIYLSADSRQWIIVAIWLADLWRATSLLMVIMVSGLLAISDEILEAAELFGAGLWQRVWHIILPLLRPSLQVALILRTIFAVQVFGVVVMIGGGEIVTTLANETFRQYSSFRNENMAAAYGVFILAISMSSAILYLRMIRSQEEMAQ
jgi:multiple sugar transport system permease protein